MSIELHLLEQELGREARIFEGRTIADDAASPRSFIIADFEYRWDRSRYGGYAVAEGTSAEREIRWPFHRIVAASWIVLRFEPTGTLQMDSPVVHCVDVETEQSMAASFFSALDSEPGAIVTTWGGECKDFAVLRRCAAEFGLMLPTQLLDLSPYSRHRLDLCSAVSVQAANVHLSEYAAASAIPAKPSPPKDIGKLVEQQNWPKVREQVAADVMTTSVIAMRHLMSRGEIRCDVVAATKSLVDHAVAALPTSEFVQRTLKPWTSDICRQARLRGLIRYAA